MLLGVLFYFLQFENATKLHAWFSFFLRVFSILKLLDGVILKNVDPKVVPNPLSAEDRFFTLLALVLIYFLQFNKMGV